VTCRLPSLPPPETALKILFGPSRSVITLPGVIPAHSHVVTLAPVNPPLPGGI